MHAKSRDDRMPTSVHVNVECKLKKRKNIAKRSSLGHLYYTRYMFPFPVVPNLIFADLYL